MKSAALAGIFAVIVAGATAQAGTRTCAVVVARAGSDWALASLPPKLNILHASVNRDGRLVLLHAPHEKDRPPTLLEFDLSGAAATVHPRSTEVPRTSRREDARNFRPTVFSRDEGTAATIFPLGGTTVTLHAAAATTDPERTTTFELAADESGDGTHDPFRAAAMLDDAMESALNLSFSPNGRKLLGWNAFGLEVQDVATLTRNFAYTPRGNFSVRFAGWLDDENVVEISRQGLLSVHDLRGAVQHQAQLDFIELFELNAVAGLVVAPPPLESPLLVTHSYLNPGSFEFRHRTTLALVHTVTLEGFAPGTEIDWVEFLPEGIAIFCYGEARAQHVVAVNLAAALRQNLTTLTWQPPPF